MNADTGESSSDSSQKRLLSFARSASVLMEGMDRVAGRKARQAPMRPA
jgi:hypothetical protein